MRINTFSCLAATAAVFSVGCVVRQPSVTPPGSVPLPESNAQSETPSSVGEALPVGGPWAFRYTSGSLTYAVSTDGQIVLLPDSSNKRTIPLTTQQVTLTVLPDGATQLVTPPAPSSPACDSAAALATRAFQLLPKIPERLSAGFTWSDTAYVEGCRGNIPAAANVAYTYTVIGDTLFHSTKALHVVRSEMISARGEGNEGQHRVLLNAVEVGDTDLFFDVVRGRFLGSVGRQTANIEITTSGRVSRFRQQVTERVILLPPR